MSKFVLELANLMDNCPVCWQNFAYSLPNADLDESNGFGIDTLNKHLARFHARYFPAKEYFINSKVHFETEADFIAFRIMYG